MQQNLGVGAAAEMRPGSCELGSQSAKVIDRAVEDDAERSVPQRHGLRPGIAEVEDGQPPMAQHGAIPALDALAVRPAAGQLLNHPLNRLHCRRRIFDPDNTSDPAHDWLKKLKGRRRRGSSRSASCPVRLGAASGGSAGLPRTPKHWL